jgi:hypothetical protein
VCLATKQDNYATSTNKAISMEKEEEAGLMIINTTYQVMYHLLLLEG